MSQTEIHKKTMDAIQQEWEENRDQHIEQRKQFHGIRSSQVSAMVATLIKMGVITEHHLRKLEV